jgi:hypothetical protein
MTNVLNNKNLKTNIINNNSYLNHTQIFSIKPDEQINTQYNFIIEHEISQSFIPGFSIYSDEQINTQYNPIIEHDISQSFKPTFSIDPDEQINTQYNPVVEHDVSQSFEPDYLITPINAGSKICNCDNINCIKCRYQSLPTYLTCNCKYKLCPVKTKICSICKNSVCPFCNGHCKARIYCKICEGLACITCRDFWYSN